MRLTLVPDPHAAAVFLGALRLQKKKTKWIEDPVEDVTEPTKHMYEEDKWEHSDNADGMKQYHNQAKKVRDVLWGAGMVVGRAGGQGGCGSELRSSTGGQAGVPGVPPLHCGVTGQLMQKHNRSTSVVYTCTAAGLADRGHSLRQLQQCQWVSLLCAAA